MSPNIRIEGLGKATFYVDWCLIEPTLHDAQKILVSCFISKPHLKNKLKNVIMEQSWPEVANFSHNAYEIDEVDGILTSLNSFLGTCKILLHVHTYSGKGKGQQYSTNTKLLFEMLLKVGSHV